MRKLAVLALAALMGVSALTLDTRPAEARRGGAVIAGLIGGIAIGAILAHRHRHRPKVYYYRYDRPAYYHGGYYRPYKSYYAPRRYYRVHRYKTHRYRHRW